MLITSFKNLILKVPYSPTKNYKDLENTPTKYSVNDPNTCFGINSNGPTSNKIKKFSGVILYTVKSSGLSLLRKRHSKILFSHY